MDTPFVNYPFHVPDRRRKFPFGLDLAWHIGINNFVYKISISAKEAGAEEAGHAKREKDHFPALSFAIIMISLLFFMSGQFVGGILQEPGSDGF